MAVENGVVVIASIGYRARSRRVALLMAFVLATSACGGSDDVAETSDTHRYELVGDVVSVDSEQGTVTLEHQPVADFMGVMTMPFNVREQWVLGAVVPGAQVKATLVESGVIPGAVLRLHVHLHPLPAPGFLPEDVGALR
jgi:Cu/Ag efflux protein CusF